MVAISNQVPDGAQIKQGVGFIMAAVLLFLMSLGGANSNLKWAKMRGGQPMGARAKRVAQIILRIAAVFCVCVALACILRQR